MPLHIKRFVQGVQWLIDNWFDEYPWLRYLQNPVPKFTLTQITNAENLGRFLKSINYEAVMPENVSYAFAGVSM